MSVLDEKMSAFRLCMSVLSHAHFGHRKDGVLGSDAERGVYRKTDTSAHYDWTAKSKHEDSYLARLLRTCRTVHEADHRLLHQGDVPIQRVFILKEVNASLPRLGVLYGLHDGYMWRVSVLILLIDRSKYESPNL